MIRVSQDLLDDCLITPEDINDLLEGKARPLTEDEKRQRDIQGLRNWIEEAEQEIAEREAWIADWKKRIEEME